MIMDGMMLIKKVMIVIMDGMGMMKKMMIMISMNVWLTG